MEDKKAVDADGYYDDDVDTDEEIDLSFLDEKDEK
jgi:hypothetical protein